MRRANPLLGALERKGGPWKSRLFCTKKALVSLIAISGPKKVSIGSCLPQNNYVPRHIHNRYINCYYTFSGVRQKVKALLTVHLKHHFFNGFNTNLDIFSFPQRLQLDKNWCICPSSKVLVRCLSPRPIPLHTGANIGLRKTFNQKYRISKFAKLANVSHGGRAHRTFNPTIARWPRKEYIQLFAHRGREEKFGRWKSIQFYIYTKHS